MCKSILKNFQKNYITKYIKIILYFMQIFLFYILLSIVNLKYCFTIYNIHTFL